MKFSILSFALMISIPPALVFAQSPEPAAPAPSACGSSSSEAGTPAKPPKKPKKGRRAVLEGFEIPPPGSSSGTRVTSGGTRGGEDDPVTLLAPHFGKILGESPRFEWDSAGKSGPYVMEIQDEKAAVVVHEMVEREFYTPGGGKGAFEAGRTYAWWVSLRSTFGRLYSPKAFFTVVSPAERAEIENALAAIEPGESYGSLMTRARILRDRRIWYDAVGAYTDVITRFPDRPEPYDERGQIYGQIEATTKLSEQDYMKADSLRAEK